VIVIGWVLMEGYPMGLLMRARHPAPLSLSRVRTPRGIWGGAAGFSGVEVVQIRV
jgi:hypothetical protein